MHYMQVVLNFYRNSRELPGSARVVHRKNVNELYHLAYLMDSRYTPGFMVCTSQNRDRVERVWSAAPGVTVSVSSGFAKAQRQRPH